MQDEVVAKVGVARHLWPITSLATNATWIYLIIMQYYIIYYVLKSTDGPCGLSGGKTGCRPSPVINYLDRYESNVNQL
jgi:hypothetical protein